MELLMNSSQKMQQGRDEQETIELAAEQVSKLLNRPILYALAGKGGRPFLSGHTKDKGRRASWKYDGRGTGSGRLGREE